MIRILVAALALTVASSLHAQAAPVAAPAVDPSFATPAVGTWTYSSTADGSEASFAGASAQLTLHCTRAIRQVVLSRPATGAAPFLSVWTTGLNRNLPASFNPATGRLSATLAAFDPLLDAIAFSRGRVGVGISGQPLLIVPAWQDATRVIEDCRV